MPEDPAYNPYTPASKTQESLGGSVHDTDTASVIYSLGRWQFALSVLILGLCVLGGGGLIFYVIAESDGDYTAAIGGLACSVPMLLIVYVVPALLLMKAAQASSQYASNPNDDTLNTFARAQRRFWRTSILIMAVIIVMYIGLMFVAMFGWTMAVDSA